MSDNPFIGRGGRGGGATWETLNAHAGDLNRMNWVKASGQPYFVNKRVDDEGVKHFLDRRIYA